MPEPSEVTLPISLVAVPGRGHPRLGDDRREPRAHDPAAVDEVAAAPVGQRDRH